MWGEPWLLPRRSSSRFPFIFYVASSALPLHQPTLGLGTIHAPSSLFDIWLGSFNQSLHSHLYKTHHPSPHKTNSNPPLPSPSLTNPPSRTSEKIMENTSQATLAHSLSLAEPLGFLFLNTILIWFSRLQKLSLRLFSFIASHAELPACSSREQRPKNSSSEVRGDFQLGREDVEMVMGCMGMAYSREDEQLKELMGFDELSIMFEEKEPSLEEVKEAFCVFDVNCDGFIDAMELQVVLSKLGFGEGLALDACERMIAAYDDNQDMRIDFNEFVKFMESSFC